MRLFWKVFLLLMLTLLVTAGLSSWLGQKWLAENQAIDSRLNNMASQGEAAASLFEMEDPRAFRRWLHQSVRSQGFHGALVDAQGEQLLRRPLPPEMQGLLQQVMEKKQRVSIINPPMLAVALPVQLEDKTYYWLAISMMTQEELQQGGRDLRMIQLLSAVLIIALLSWLLTRMFTRPIRQLLLNSLQLAAGFFTTRTPQNLSRRKDELGDLARSFDHMAEALEGLVNSHKQIIRDISHELRSPLARLQVALELARNVADDSAADELDRIGIEAERLNDLIGEVLTLARFEQGAVQAQNEPLELHEILQILIEDADFEAEAMDKKVSALLIESCTITGDPLWITRALDNVIRNAIRHTRENGSVEVSLHNRDGHAMITVRDFGEGVDEKLLSDLFDPFFRASEARERHNTKQASGYGLGLAIAKRAIELHHGSIVARNHPQGGLVVTITLPIT